MGIEKEFNKEKGREKWLLQFRHKMSLPQSLCMEGDWLMEHYTHQQWPIDEFMADVLLGGGAWLYVGHCGVGVAW